MLNIETFQNADLSHGWRPGNNAGGSTLFKALGHPLAARKGRALVEGLKGKGPVALYDPTGMIGNFNSYFDLKQLEIEGYYVQRVEDLDGTFLGHKARPLSQMKESKAAAVLVLLFDAKGVLAPLTHLFPKGADVRTLDEMRIPDEMLTNQKKYLDPMNFATNFALLRERKGANGSDGLHSTVATANYWSMHGAADPELWLCLFDEGGNQLAEWTEGLPQAGAPFTLDSQEIRTRFGLDDFTGSLFIHAVRIAGHDVVKYALDVYGDNGKSLTCSHDANAWPADYYAGMPAGEEDEEVLLYIQNSHPMPIPPNSIGLNIMGAQDVAWYEEEIPPFATHALNVNALLPQAKWPDQVEVTAGRFFVRPRYEVRHKENGRRRIAHANVERIDLKADPNIPALSETMGKGYIMPLPVLPQALFTTTVLPTPMARDEMEMPLRIELMDGDGTLAASKYLGRIPRRESVAIDIDAWIAEESAKLPSVHQPVLPQALFTTTVLPTPMARDEMEMPLRIELMDGDGTLAASKYLGRIPRRESVAIDIDAWIAEESAKLPSGFGHVEFLYDFREGGEANGWLHALGRFEQKASGHRAETIFGAHIYNTPIIYKDEPQSYTNKPPGLTTRLFLRLARGGEDTMCHLVYPASLPWHEKSSTKLILHNGKGEPVAERAIEIACGGSHFWRYKEMFSEEERAKVDGLGYVIVRDTTCRLFGFHGLLNGEESFCLDHMFGF